MCLVWGGRSVVIAQHLLEHGSASVGFEDYKVVLEMAQQRLPQGVQVTLLADRGFEHGALIRWLQQQQWNWAIRTKSDLTITLSTGRTAAVAELLPPQGEAYLFSKVTILQDIDAHLATAHLDLASEPWALLSNLPPTLATFEL